MTTEEEPRRVRLSPALGAKYTGEPMPEGDPYSIPIEKLVPPGVKSAVKKYRKRPVVIAAIQLSEDTWAECIGFLGPDLLGGSGASCQLGIRTREGNITAVRWDYIVRGVKGEHYAVKPDIFEATYEAV